MKRVFTNLIIMVAMLLISLPSSAQFNISAELRPRSEYSHGYKTLAAKDQKASFFTSQRTRLNLNYKNEKITSKITLQDVRTWGAQKQLVDNNYNNLGIYELDMTSIHEAWAEAFLTEELSLKIGRQEVIYDDHRIFGSVGWAQQARSHDMAIIKYESSFKIHLGLAYNQNTNRSNNFYQGSDAYKAMQVLWINKEWDNLNLSVLVLNNGTPLEELDAGGNIINESTIYSQTFGPRAVYKMGDLKLSGNVYIQTGKDRADNKLSAFEAAIDANYKLSSELSTFAGYEILSGTAYDETETNKSFTPLYGTNHKFNGFMDYFYVGNHGSNVGLSDIHLGAKYTKDKFFAQAKVLLFSSAAKINADASNYLGTEIDLWCGYKLTKEIDFGIGYSQMFASESMQILKGVAVDSQKELQNWAYLQVTFKPNFFTYKKPEAPKE